MQQEQDSYPKVLILGETFRYNGGGGITLINLFKNWKPDHLAVVTERINETSFDAGCKKFYRLGHLEVKMPFPFNLINKIQASGEVNILSQNPSSVQVQHKRTTLQTFKFSVEKTYYAVISLLGFIISNYKIRVSDQLLRWIDNYSPQIIYAQPFSYKDMIFACDLKKATGLPLALHIMDDSVSFLNKPNLLFFYWKRKVNTIFKQLIDKADIHLSISDAMSDEYFKRYKKQFLPFRNPIDIKTWLPVIKSDWKLAGQINVVYTGRLAVPNINALLTICNVVEKINSIVPIRIHIYSIDKNNRFYAKIRHLESVVIHNAVPFSKIPSLITQFDLTVLPIDFTKSGIKYAKYSVSTKTSEYMISGVPILLFAPEEVALTAYAKKNKCMYSVSENNEDGLFDGFMELINNYNLRVTIAQKAIEVAKSDSVATEVRKRFVDVLQSCASRN